MDSKPHKALPSGAFSMQGKDGLTFMLKRLCLGGLIIGCTIQSCQSIINEFVGQHPEIVSDPDFVQIIDLVASFFAMPDTVFDENMEHILNPQMNTAEIPEVLNSPKARMLWRRLIAAGVLDQRLQPLLRSKSDCAVLGNLINEELGIVGKWKPLEQLWKMTNLSKLYDKAVCRKKFDELNDRFKKIILGF